MRCKYLEWLQINTGLDTARGILTKSHAELPHDTSLYGNGMHSQVMHQHQANILYNTKPDTFFLESDKV